MMHMTSITPFQKPLLFTKGFTVINSELGHVEKAIVFMIWSPLNLQKGYHLCKGWQHHSTVLAYSAL